LLMTATPITDTPRELFTILNTLIADPKERLMDFEKFRGAYTTAEGKITETGRAYFRERAKGLISYLNREYDPTTFAQPVFEDVVVPAGGVVYPSVEDLVARCTADLDRSSADELVMDDCEEVKKEMNFQLGVLERSGLKPKEMAKALTRKRKMYNQSYKECVKRNLATRKAHAKAVKSLLKTASACYLAQKKAFSGDKGPSQLKEIEACFGKSAKADEAGFPSKGNFTEALRTYLESRGPMNEEDAGSVEAVLKAETDGRV